MKQNNSFEILLSAAVLVVAGGFFFFAYSSTGGASLSDYDLTVKLRHADGLTPGSDVRIGGVKVGNISSLALDHFTAVAHIRIRDGVAIPTDSGFSIAAGGLTPGSYLSIAPGHAAALAPGASITVAN